MDNDGEPITQLLGALTVCLGQTARAVSELLNHEDMSATERQALRTTVARSVHAAALTMDRACPGSGETLTRIYAGYQGPEA